MFNPKCTWSAPKMRRWEAIAKIVEAWIACHRIDVRCSRWQELVRDNPKLLDNGGEIPKSQGRGWRFESRLWNLLSTWHNCAKWSIASCASVLTCRPSVSKGKERRRSRILHPNRKTWMHDLFPSRSRRKGSIIWATFLSSKTPPHKAWVYGMLTNKHIWSN